MSTSQPAEHAGLVVPVHTSVPGRTRLAVVGLYRSRSTKQKLEKYVGGLDGVRRVEANIRTGRLLVVYSPGLLLEELVALVDDLLGKLGHRPQESGRIPIRARRVAAVTRVHELFTQSTFFVRSRAGRSGERCRMTPRQ